MTAEVINLRQFKRAKAREDQDRHAEVNRAAFGRTTAQRILEKTRALQDKSKLDAHLREDSPTPPDPA